MNLTELEPILAQKIATIASADDPAHDLLHFKRVVKFAKQLCVSENANLEIVVPAAWLHDFVIIPKNDPRRKQASRLSAEAAVQFLRELHHPEIHLDSIHDRSFLREAFQDCRNVANRGRSRRGPEAGRGHATLLEGSRRGDLKRCPSTFCHAPRGRKSTGTFWESRRELTAALPFDHDRETEKI